MSPQSTHERPGTGSLESIKIIRNLSITLFKVAIRKWGGTALIRRGGICCRRTSSTWTERAASTMSGAPLASSGGHRVPWTCRCNGFFLALKSILGVTDRWAAQAAAVSAQVGGRASALTRRGHAAQRHGGASLQRHRIPTQQVTLLAHIVFQYLPVSDDKLSRVAVCFGRRGCYRRPHACAAICWWQIAGNGGPPRTAS